jgi:hypothetical protein
VKADSPIKSMKDMDGKTMGYSRPGSSTNLVALALSEYFKVKPKLVSTGGIPDTRTQVMSGQIDAGKSALQLRFSWSLRHARRALVRTRRSLSRVCRIIEPGAAG